MRYVEVELSFHGNARESVTLVDSTAHDETLDQRLWKARAAHALLHGGNIVGHAAKFDDLMLQVGDGKSGARIAVARLADGTGIEEIAAGKLDAQGGQRFGDAGMNLQNLELRVLIGKAALVMGVPEEGDFGGGIQKAFQGLRRSENVFVFILKGAMDQHDAIRGQRAVGQSRQPGQMIGLELRASP